MVSMQHLNKFIIPIIFVFVCSLSLVYSSFTEGLVINGEAYIRVDADIRITDIQMTGATNQGYETYKSQYSVNSISTYVTLPNIDSTVTYRITITNNSSYLYVIEELANSLVNDNITYTIDDFSLGHAIDASTVDYLDITFKYKDDVTEVPEDITQTSSIAFTFSIPYASLLHYDNSKSGSVCEDVQCALDDLYSRIS
jgi:hypothetical protein